MKLTLAEAALGCGAVLEAPTGGAQPGALTALGYSIDSRSVGAGELFFAIRGDRFDGHDYVTAALERGAVGAVVSRAKVAALPDAALAAPLLIVEDPLAALQALAAHVRRHWKGRVVAVTGSAGKTTTKDAIAAALGARFRVLKSRGNLNNHIGLPLQLLRLEPEHEYAVVEMGMNHAGEIAALARIASPDWGVVTNVGTAHIENFPDGQSGIARAKYELVAALPSTGIAFLNCDDRCVSQFGRGFLGRVLYFGTGPCADPQAMEVIEDATGLTIALRTALGDPDQQAGGERTEDPEPAPVEDRVATLKLGLTGRHNALNALAGLAVALAAGVPLESALLALEQLKPGEKRGQVLNLRGATILNDCYNSNPEALQSMIQTLAQWPLPSVSVDSAPVDGAAGLPVARARRILVAGEMLELGEYAPDLHTACGRAAAAAGLDMVVGVRGQASHLVQAAGEAGVGSVFLPDAEAAGAWLAANLHAGDVVLLKGSRGVGMERALAALQSPASIPAGN